MNILILTPLNHFIDDISLCNSYNSVMTFFLLKYFRKYNINCSVLAVEDAFTIKQVSKSNYETFKRLIIDTSIFDSYDHILILGIKSLRTCDSRIIDYLKKFKGKVIELDETAKRRNNNFITAFMIKDVEYPNAKFIGQGVDLDFLYPEKNNKTLEIHVDHPWPDRSEYFDKIFEKNNDLVEKKYYKNFGFDNVRFTFHTEVINDISQINNKFSTKSIPFTELAKIYRRTHIAFISHRETMGNYPLEMAACGATIILPDKSAVPGGVISQIDYSLINHDNFWESILSCMNEIQIKNAILSQKFSYDIVVERIINIFKG